MRECKACLAMACAGKASLALQAYFQKPPDSCASLLIALAKGQAAGIYDFVFIDADKRVEISLLAVANGRTRR